MRRILQGVDNDERERDFYPGCFSRLALSVRLMDDDSTRPSWSTMRSQATFSIILFSFFNS